MNALELLKHQHEEVRGLFERILHTDDDRQALLRRLADDLDAHTTIEEEIFYPAAYAHQRSNELFLQAVDEHELMRQLTAALLSMSPDDDEFLVKLNMLRNEVAQHMAEEEQTLFALAATHLSEDELRRLGLEMEELFDEEQAEQPLERLPLYMYLSPIL